MKQKTNIFTAISTWMAASDTSEFCLVAGEDFRRETVPSELLDVLAIARRNYPAPASGVLAYHYNQFEQGQQSHSDMVDSSTGWKKVGDVNVQFTVRKIRATPLTFEVTFKRT